MTIDEKKRVIKRYCDKSMCHNCEIRGLSKYNEMCFDEDAATEDELNKAIEFIGYSSDNVNHPAHYQGANECIDVMLAMFGVEAVKNFCKCNAYKYRFRSQAKNGDEDIKKAEWYESKLIELEEANT